MEERGPQSTTAELDRIRRRWHFRHSILDERTHELTVAGVDTEIERKPLEVLIYLLQHAGEVCTKDELLANVWPGRVLSETVLTKCIGRLREVLGDDEQEIIKTAYGFGYRLVAPVRVETAPLPAPPHFEFRPGDHPVGRPLWSLVEKLGGGGHGEAWRARHDKTNEQRVFKFALDESSLITLKREITLFRVINDTLGESARVIKLLDWNLEQLPYFVEAEYIPGGNLIEWVNIRGGAAAIPLADRLEIVARIAEALGAVHSVGVLHKDLKPSNILVRPTATGAPDIVLGDFGSGGMLDATRLDSLGITRLGFTKTLASIEGRSGTPMYLAPEVLAGQPFTVKSDMYALGIVLYQFLCGDFHKVMSPGWERGIDDELLREDIALMAEGNPAERLGDAQGLARRLRTLQERRTQLAAERDAQAKAERARRLLERAQARRLGLALAFGALFVGLIASTTLYFRARHAQELTVIAAAQSRAVKDFLSKDVFAPVSSGTEPVRDMTVIQLLTRAGNEIDTRFASQPDVAAELHYVIGRSFQSFLETSQAVKHFRQALELGEHLSGQGSQAAMRSASELIQVDYFVGQLEGTIGRYNAILTEGRKRAGEHAPEVLDLRLNLARGYYLMGAWGSASRMFQDLLADIAAAGGSRSELEGRVQFYYGQLLTDLAEPVEAQQHLRLALDELRSSLGDRHVMVTEAHSALGRTLADAGRFSEAASEFSKAHELAVKWAPLPSWIETRPRFFTALMLLHEDQAAKAEPLLAEIVRFQDTHEAAYLESHKGLTPELDHTGPVRQALGEAYARQGRLSEAIETLERAVSVGARASGARHPLVVSAKLSLAEALIADHRHEDARHVVASIQASELTALPSAHPILAHWYRVNGLLDLGEEDVANARGALTHARDIFQSAYGPRDWRVARATQDLQLISSARTQQ
jgi:DNA-binding winged helix-turn-helix (wHTH) protein/tetratricopeptide (TPR) repeat protein